MFFFHNTYSFLVVLQEKLLFVHVSGFLFDDNPHHYSMHLGKQQLMTHRLLSTPHPLVNGQIESS